MARIQILELPTIYRSEGPDETPFVLVIDEYVHERYILGPDEDAPVPRWDGIAEQIGARGILVFEETVELPGNYVSVNESGHAVRLKVVPDLTDFGPAVAAVVADANERVAAALTRYRDAAP